MTAPARQPALVHACHDSPLGMLSILLHGARICAVEFDDRQERLHKLAAKGFPGLAIKDGPLPAPIARAFTAYFEGDLTALDGLEVEQPGSPFEREVWAGLRRIPAGQTRSYGALAADLGQPGAARAVGRANGLNAVSIIVPCHRVIGADGRLTGYAGGVERKAWLLRHEGALAV